MMPPPCLTIRVPGSSSLSIHSNHSTPAFGISSYSHRTAPKPRSTAASRFRDMFAAPAAEVTPSSPVVDVSLSSRMVVNDGDVVGTSAWEDDDDDDSDLERVATARIAGPSRRSPSPTLISNPIPFPIILGVEPPTPDQDRPLRKSDSLDSSSHSSYHSHSHSTSQSSTSPVGTFVSVSNAGSLRASIAPSYVAESGHSNAGSSRRVLRWSGIGRKLGMDKAVLSVYSKKETRSEEKNAQLVEEWREKIIFQENEICKGTPPANLKRMYLCPWEAISPRAFRRQQGADVEKQAAPSTSPPSSLRRHLAPALALLSLLLLLTNLLLLDIKLFHSSFHSPTTLTAIRNADTCLSLFALTAPSSPPAFPCTPCLTALTSLPTSHTLEQTQVLQFCALGQIFAASSSDGLAAEGWMASSDVCGFGGVGCDERGRVTKLSMGSEGEEMVMPASAVELLRGSLELLELDGVDVTKAYLG